MTLLLLAGTGEARQLAAALAAHGVAALASLAGATRDPAPLALPTRTGGFGGADGFRAYLARNAVRAVLDATHPHAARITERTARICGELGLPYLRLDRPGWRPEPGDRWIIVPQEADVPSQIRPQDVVFLATGRQSLAAFQGLAANVVHLRQIDPPSGPFPLPRGGYVTGRPPFSVEDETRLFRDLGITVLVTKNAGTPLARAKLDAARALGLRVVMIDRPPRPAARVVETVDEALDWALSTCG